MTETLTLIKRSLLKCKLNIITINYKLYYVFRNLFLHGANFFDFPKQRSLIAQIRNFYGETLGFYFQFINSLSIWLLFPVIVGIIVYGLHFFPKVTEKPFVNNPMEYRDIISFVFCFLITIWGKNIIIIFN